MTPLDWNASGNWNQLTIQNKDKTMKLKEIREKSIEELKELILDSKKQLLNFRMQKALQKLENTAQIGQLKTVIAQAKTLIKEKSEVK